MSLKGLIQPTLAHFWFNPERFEKRRNSREKRRKKTGRDHVVSLFHNPGDPYSHLLLQALPQFLERYPVQLNPYTVQPPGNSMIPEPDLLAQHAHKDCLDIAPHYGLRMPMYPPSKEELDRVISRLLQLEKTGDYLNAALEMGDRLWTQNRNTLLEQEDELHRSHDADILGMFSPGYSIEKQHADNIKTLHRLGHYLSGTLYYEGEWYWGIDRLQRLENRLERLGVGKGSCLKRTKAAIPYQGGRTLTFYFSFRSPYSYLASEMLCSLVQTYDLNLVLKPILPMVMRGLPVVHLKRKALLHDALREAVHLQIPMGRISDPLGRGVKNALGVVCALEDPKLAIAFMHNTFRAIWAEGVEIATYKGLLKVAQKSNIDTEMLNNALNISSWKSTVEKNRLELRDLGLWGVPCFQLGNFVVWGQDRVWLLRDLLEQAVD